MPRKHERAFSVVAWFASACQPRFLHRECKANPAFGPRHFRVERRKRQRGQVIPILAVSSTVLISLASLALDMGLAQDAHTASQVATDAAAETAAYQLANGGGYGPNSTTELDALGIAYLNGIRAGTGGGVHNNECQVPGSYLGTSTDYYYDVPPTGCPAVNGWKYVVTISIPPATPMSGCNIAPPFNCAQVQAQAKAVPILGGIVGFGAVTNNTSAVAQDNAGSFTSASGQPSDASNAGGTWVQQGAPAQATIAVNQVPSPNASGAQLFSQISSANPANGNYLRAVSCAATNFCMAVGDYACTNGACAGQEQTLIEQWDGNNWNVVPSGNDATTDSNYLYGVSCNGNANNFCWAVGYYQLAGSDYPLVQEWNGISWTSLSQPAYANDVLYSVSCSDPTFCIAVGANSTGPSAFAEEWDSGPGWSPSAVAAVGTNSNLEAVSCTSNSFCMATGYQVAAGGASRQTLTEEFGSTGGCSPCAWTPIPSFNQTVNANELQGISCNQTTVGIHTNFFCLSTGYYSNGISNLALAEYWQGLNWSAANPLAVSGSLDGVDCQSASWCMATLAGTPAEVWNGIAAVPQWTQVNANPAGGNNSFSGVSCASQTMCMAVGYSGGGGNYQTLIEQLGTSPSASALNAVSCFSSSFCMAVGDFNVGGGISQTLIEEWGPSGCDPSTTCSWSPVSSPNAGISISNYLSGVSCYSIAMCMAVGYFVDPVAGNRPLAVQWNGSNWGLAMILPSLSATGGDELQSISCPTVSLCMAVGFESATSPVKTLVEQWGNPGGSCPCAWVPTGPGTVAGQDSYLSSVSCKGNAMCMAVGYDKISGNFQPLADSWNGSWSVSPAIPPVQGALTNQLVSVSCASSVLCIAVGSYFDGVSIHTLADSWSGSSWGSSPILPPNPVGTTAQQLTGISCDSTSDCWASGQALGAGGKQTLVEMWASGAFAIAASPTAGGGDSQLQGISCWTLYSCFTVGTFLPTSGLSQTVILQIGQQPQTNVLDSVSCTSGNQCLAVGYYQNLAGTWQTLAESWNGTAWSLVNPPNIGTGNNDLTGVDCPSSTWCIAVGWYTGGSGKQTMSAIWTSSTGWSAASPGPNPSASDNAFNSVACLGQSNCWGVGYVSSGGVEQTLIALYTGTWAVQASGNGNGSFNNLLTGVACPTPSLCMAVGYYGVSTTVNQVLIEQNNGGNPWSLTSTSSTQFDTATNLNNQLQGVSCHSSAACEAVGFANYPTNPSFNQTLIEQWQAGSWSVTSNDTSGLYDQSTSDNEMLFGDSCQSNFKCVSVGGAGNSTKALVESPAGWTVSAPINPAASDELLAVSCWSDTQCAAVGDYSNVAAQPLVETYQGVNGGNNNPGVRTNGLTSVSGTSASSFSPSTSSITVGNYINGKNADVGYSELLKTDWNSGSWDSTVLICPATICSQTTSYYLKGLSCIGTNFCTAVGFHCDGEDSDCNPENQSNGNNAIPLAVECLNTCDQSNGVWCATSCSGIPGGWWLVNPAPPAPSNVAYLNSVSRAALSYCIAAGQYRCSGGACSGHYQTLIEQWGPFGCDPSLSCSWSLVTSQNQGGPTINNYLLGVSCSSSTLCKAVGYASGATYDEALILDQGSSWGIDASFGQINKDNYLTGVSCAGAALCMASGYYCNTRICASSSPQTIAESCTSCDVGPSSWADTSPLNASASDELLAVDCMGSASCLAVGYYSSGGFDNALVESWGPGGWHVNGADRVCNGGQNAHLRGVSESSNSGAGIAVGDCDNGVGGNDTDAIFQNFAEVGGSNASGTGVTLVG